eukprot:TRINITY_DN14388_c0_g1_i2.p1 TRINITY_DN14388_c0_g1~~TRINITY_DN14388_c0_g1_i2.p1  ORF type:complete len:254 (+),score=71.67 TRINITY_DN14388_c0_g1_i2:70-831(+)
MSSTGADMKKIEEELLRRNQEIDQKTAKAMQFTKNDASPSASLEPPSASTRESAQQSVTNSILSSKITSLEEQLQSTISKMKQMERERDKAVEEATKQTKSVTSLTTRIDRDKTAKDEAIAKAKQNEQLVLTLKRESASLKKALKATETQASAKDTKIQQLTEQLEKCRNQASSHQGQNKDQSDTHKEQLAKLQSDNRKLQAQKAELLTGFKKQAKLIDILKRQKMHVEAAKLLSFTEEEFMRTLDLGGSLAS